MQKISWTIGGAAPVPMAGWPYQYANDAILDSTWAWIGFHFVTHCNALRNFIMSLPYANLFPCIAISSAYCRMS